MDNPTSQPGKSIRPLWATVASLALAIFIALIYTAQLVTDVPRNPGAVVPDIALLPFLSLVGLVLYFFAVFSPILGLLLLISAVIPSQRRASRWLWVISCTVFLLSLPAFYFSLRRDSRQPANEQIFSI